MKLSQEQFELVEAYLAGELSAADQVRFEQDIADDPALAAEIEQQRTLRLGLQALAIEQRLQQARRRVAQVAPPVAGEMVVVRPLRDSGTSRSTSWRYWAAAASVVIGLGIGTYWYRQQAMVAELAYADTATADQLTKSLPADLQPTDRKQITDAIRDYKAGQYDRAIKGFRAVTPAARGGTYQHYLLGLSYMANKQPAQAIPAFQTALGTASGVLRQKARWFLALAYIQTDDKQKALPILDNIRTDRTHPYREQAGQVWQKIR